MAISCIYEYILEKIYLRYRRRVRRVMITIRKLDINRCHDLCQESCDSAGSNCYLFLFIRTQAVFSFDGKETVTMPNTMILFDISSPLYPCIYDGEHIEDSMVFESDEDIRFPVNTPVYIGNEVDIAGYMQLINEAYSRGRDLSCCMLVNAMFSEVAAIAAKEKSLVTPHADKLIPLRYDMYAHPDREWTIKSMAETLYVSETYFQQLYKNTFGISCGADIIAARIRYGMTLLSETGRSITEISRLCGYNSPAHFSRQFKLIANITPTAYRRSKRMIRT